MDSKISEILSLVNEYITNKQNNTKWEAGKDWVKYAGNYFDSTEYMNAIESLLNGWLVLGNDAIKFENKFPRLFNKQHGILTNSGSSSNLLMMLAMISKNGYGFPKGTKVLTPIAGFPTTLNPILQLGLTPIFVDIELDTLNLDLDYVEKVLKDNPDCKIITFAHVLGNPPNMNRLMDIVKQYNLVLLEDCCDALGSTYDGNPLGSFGDMASCSFYPAHHITMGEGGFVATKTYELETVVRSFREWGRACYCVGEKANLLKNGTCKCRFNNWLPSMPDDIFDHKYVYTEIGYNLKPIELQASIGLAQLDKLPFIIERRKENYKLLLSIFENYSDVFHLPYKQLNSDPSWFAFPLTIKDNAKFNRWDICNFLEDNKIQTRPYFAGNLLLQPAYSEIANNNYDEIKKNYPNATKVTRDTFFLGTSPVITSDMILYIGDIINKFFKERY